MRGKQDVDMEQLQRAAAEASARPQPAAQCAASRTIAVDLTRLLPGGVNGGAKLMTLELVERMARLAPGWRFFLLTAASSHDELRALDRSNVRRICVQGGAGHSPGLAGRGLAQLRAALRHRPWGWLRWLWGLLAHRPRRLPLLAEERVDCLLFPLTAPLFYAPGVPSVGVIYDLQHATFPEFFTFEDRYFREKFFRDCVRRTNHVVCISNYARESVLSRASIPAERISTIYIGHSGRLPAPASDDQRRVCLARWGIEDANYWLYPANSWPHKNHLRLFDALARYLATGGKIRKLVCSGADTGRHAELRQAIERWGLRGNVVLTGYVGSQELGALYEGCRAVVFPSLYEGFGMPIVEAMAFGKPVICSNTTSLPEIAGGAAIEFDPLDPASIAAALTRCEADPNTAERIARGRQQAARFGTADEMAQAYLYLLERVSLAESAPAKAPAVGRHNRTRAAA